MAAMVSLRQVAVRLGLLDRPAGHKRHQGAIPVVGGLAMFVGLAVAVLLTPGGAFDATVFLVAAAILVAVGALDDTFMLSSWLRLVAHAGAALWMYSVSTSSGVRLTSLGDLLGTGVLDVSAFAPLATVFVIVAGINAFNMLDGLDGLAGGVALVALLLLLTALPGSLCPAFLQIALALVGALGAFLLFNAPLGLNRRWRSFMGDAGSTVLGFALATLLLGSSQGLGRLAAPITMVWLVLVPATDLWCSTVRRALRGQSPFHADNEHLHHMLMAAGLSARVTCAVLVLVALLGGLAGLALERAGAPEWLSLLLLLLAGWGLAAAAYVLRGVRRRAAGTANSDLLAGGAQRPG